MMDTTRNFTTDFDRMIVLFSDVEMGAGGSVDDFPHSDFLGNLLLSYLEGDLGKYPIDFVFNGDTFDLLKTPYLGEYPHSVTKKIAQAKMSSIAAAHPRFFESLGQIVGHEDENKNVHFVVGNHDAELLFPNVQSLIRALCDDSYRINFPGFSKSIGSVYMEHGSQADRLFRIDPKKPFVEYKGKQYLNLGWATVALLDMFMPLQPVMHFYDRVKPRDLVIEMVPEIRELLLALAWQYWTKDFWRDFFKFQDPMLKLNWSMMKEIVRRITTNDPNVSLEKSWVKETVEEKPFDFFILGHLHQKGDFYIGNKRVLHAGCFRDEYTVRNEGNTFEPMMKPYYEIYLKGNRVVSLITREILGPPPKPEALPDSIFDIVSKIKELLEEMGDRSDDRAAQKKQEEKEQKKKNSNS